MSKRFGDSDPSTLRLAKYARHTDYATGYAVRLLTRFATLKDVDFESVEIPQLCIFLGDFFANVQQENGESFTAASLSNLRYSIARHLKSSRDVDILKDSSFTTANEIFAGKMAMLKREGKGNVKHFDVITDETSLQCGWIVGFDRIFKPSYRSLG